MKDGLSERKKPVSANNRDEGEVYPVHDSRRCEGSPSQDPSRGTAGQSGVFLTRAVVDPQRGRPVGGGGIYHKRGGMGVSTPIILAE